VKGQTDRQRDRQVVRQTDKQAEGHTDRQKYRQTGRRTDIHTNMQQKERIESKILKK
jgi:YD repeat-containing protein